MKCFLAVALSALSLTPAAAQFEEAFEAKKLLEFTELEGEPAPGTQDLAQIVASEQELTELGLALETRTRDPQRGPTLAAWLEEHVDFAGGDLVVVVSTTLADQFDEMNHHLGKRGRIEVVVRPGEKLLARHERVVQRTRLIKFAEMMREHFKWTPLSVHVSRAPLGFGRVSLSWSRNELVASLDDTGKITVRRGEKAKSGRVHPMTLERIRLSLEELERSLAGYAQRPQEFLVRRGRASPRPELPVKRVEDWDPASFRLRVGSSGGVRFAIDYRDPEGGLELIDRVLGGLLYRNVDGPGGERWISGGLRVEGGDQLVVDESWGAQGRLVHRLRLNGLRPVQRVGLKWLASRESQVTLRGQTLPTSLTEGFFRASVVLKLRQVVATPTSGPGGISLHYRQAGKMRGPVAEPELLAGGPMKELLGELLDQEQRLLVWREGGRVWGLALHRKVHPPAELLRGSFEEPSDRLSLSRPLGGWIVELRGDYGLFLPENPPEGFEQAWLRHSPEVHVGPLETRGLDQVGAALQGTSQD